MNNAEYRLADLASIPNVVSGVGLGLVTDGCREINTVRGVTEIAAGRGLDLFDGWLARTLDQSSDTGAMIDATADKLGMATILAAAWHERAVPRTVISGIAARQGLNAGLTTLAGYRHPERSYRTPRAGKHAMFADNVALFSYLYSNALDHDHPELHASARRLRRLGMVAFTAGSVLGSEALGEYAKRLA